MQGGYSVLSVDDGGLPLVVRRARRLSVHHGGGAVELPHRPHPSLARRAEHPYSGWRQWRRGRLSVWTATPTPHPSEWTTERPPAAVASSASSGRPCRNLRYRQGGQRRLCMRAVWPGLSLSFPLAWCDLVRGRGGLGGLRWYGCSYSLTPRPRRGRPLRGVWWGPPPCPRAHSGATTVWSSWRASERPVWCGLPE